MEEKDKKQQIIIKICCFIASFVLWLYISNVENPIRTYKLGRVPVQFINKDALENSKLTLIPGEKYYVDLNLKGPVSKVYSVKLKQFKLVVDLEKYALKQGENKVPVEIREMPEGISIVNDNNLWVKIKVDSLEEKSVPIKISLYGKVKEGFHALKPISKQKFAKVIGPSTYVNKVNQVIGKCNVKNSDLDFEMQVPLKAVDSMGNIVENVNISPDFVKTKIDIKKKKLVKININTIGDANNLNIKSIVAVPDSVEIAGDNNIINNINSIDTETINLNDIKNNEINVKLILPKGVFVTNNISTIKINLQFNESIITKDINNIDISLKNESNDYIAKLEQNTVFIRVSGKESTINNLTSEDIDCYIDLKSLQEGEYNVPINVKLPNGVSNIVIKPEQVKVIIKKKVLEDNNGD
ncbi:YbbR-like protein [Clostridium acetireducens DSM 10703]|uniref:YbbR-like protein n=1 Tax=Clostridium acetireducens DSM 10703 TaxID=1121290 RepID=A0A1E8F0L5_9CLOT|nr:CdaR family protein [Clostridium acetireducens]OFI06845.1 YbbR-like protein [Clostridium acetireducens DSM 10703]